MVLQYRHYICCMSSALSPLVSWVMVWVWTQAPNSRCVYLQQGRVYYSTCLDPLGFWWDKVLLAASWWDPLSSPWSDRWFPCVFTKPSSPSLFQRAIVVFSMMWVFLFFGFFYFCCWLMDAVHVIKLLLHDGSCILVALIEGIFAFLGE